MLNTITIMGRLTRDVEMRYTRTNNKPVANFTLAVDRDIAGNDGQKVTDFIDCVAWNKAAEFVQKYFHKGSMAVVTGRLQIENYTDRDGNKRNSAVVNASSVYFGEGKTGAGKEVEEPGYQPPVFEERGDEDGELPF